MRHALIRPATAPLAMRSPCYAIAIALACALAAFTVSYATLAHFNRPSPPRANVAQYSKHQHRITPHANVRITPHANGCKRPHEIISHSLRFGVYIPADTL